MSANTSARVTDCGQIVEGSEYVGLLGKQITNSTFNRTRRRIEGYDPAMDALEAMYRAFEFSEVPSGFESVLVDAADRLREDGRIV